MATSKIIDVGLISVGDVISVPTGKIKNKGLETLTDVKVVVTVPDGLVYDSSVLPTGNYNTGDDIWENITILSGQEIEGEISFLVTDDTSPIFKISFTATTDTSCETCISDNTFCVITSGLTCSELQKCSPLLALPNEYSFIINSEDNAIDVSVNDEPCPGELVRTYAWLNTESIHGEITGLPNAATYTPEADFVGTVFAIYGLYCNDVLVDTQITIINVTEEPVINEDFDPVDELPEFYSTSVFGTKCDGERGSVKPVVVKTVVEYLARATNIVLTITEPTTLHVDPAADISVILSAPTDFCAARDIDIKHIGTTNRAFKIRVINATGSFTVDDDTYFEFDNSGSASNNARGYNLTCYNFYYDSSDNLFVK